MPKPNPDEIRDDFIKRCMGDAESVKDFPDANQRLAVCNVFWDNKGKELAFVYHGINDLEGFNLSSEVDGKRVYEKQVIYTGKFYHPLGKFWFSVNKQDLDLFEQETNRMLSDGVKVPLPVEHTENPEANRGWILSVKQRKDTKGRDSCYVLVEFLNSEAEKNAEGSDVSIFAPRTLTQGNGKVYKQPFKHVALTNNPVVYDLEPWSVIAASMSPPKETSMDIKKLLAALGLKDVEEGKEEEAALSAITKMQKELSSLKDKKETPPPKPDTKPDTKDKAPIAASMLSMLRDNRQMKIERLVERGNVTTAVGQKLLGQFTSDEALSLSLSSDSDPLNFDTIIETLSENEPVELVEKTGAQVVRLSHSYNKDGKNPLIESAKARSNNK